MVSQVLNELIAQGERKTVDEYIQNKIKRNTLLEGPFAEINESLKMMLQSLFRH